MGIFFMQGGTCTTIQDQGRFGFQHVGFSTSGVMDRTAYTLANMLVDNTIDAPVLEFGMTGPCIKFLLDTFIAITGADFEPRINGVKVSNNRAIQIHKEDVLELRISKHGMWGYLAIAGGMEIESVMGSYATNIRYKLGGFHGRCLKKGDYIELKENRTYLSRYLSRYIPDTFLKQAEREKIRVILGPQNDAFTSKGIEVFLHDTYKITEQCDRMGYRLAGEKIEHKERGADIISDGICFGAIQVPEHGEPIIMLADRQTTGGYTKIATVISVDIPTLVQKRPGERLYFEEVNIVQAEKIRQQYIEDISEISDKIHRPCQEVLSMRGAAQRVQKIWKKKERRGI